MPHSVFLCLQICLYCALFIPGLSTAVIGLFYDEIRWYGWVLALAGSIACLISCELYKAVSFAMAPIKDTDEDIVKSK